MSNNVKSYDDTQGVIENFISRLDEHNSDLQKTRQGLDKFVSIIQKELKSMDEHIGSIQDLTLQKEEKIRRFEDGYDNKIITQFTKELFNILEFIKKERKINDFASLKEIEEDLLLLLENNGIYKTNIQENDHYEEYIKLAKIVGSHITDSEQLNASIKEVVREGYYIELDKNKRALKIAEVIVNKYQRNVDV
ncbi:MAG: hypothetical protein PHR87_01000 [Sulfurospirillaceae bacterium]|nr:hypothetical protein [Sulfurospirillaceae bacterium]